MENLQLRYFNDNGNATRGGIMTVDNKLKYSDSVYMQKVKSKARQKVHYIFKNFWDIGKWESYDRIF